MLRLTQAKRVLQQNLQTIPVQRNLNMAIANQKAAWLASRSLAVAEGPSAAASAGAPAAAAGPKTPRAVKNKGRAAKTTPLGNAPGAPRGFSSSACAHFPAEVMLAGKVTLNASADVAAVNFGARQPQAMRPLRRSFGAEPLYGRSEALSSADLDRWTPAAAAARRRRVAPWTDACRAAAAARCCSA
jgi:hypothetical protein